MTGLGNRVGEIVGEFLFRAGMPYPLGATIDAEAVNPSINFAVWAPDAEQLELCLFDTQGIEEQKRLAFPVCTDGVWHGRLEGLDTDLIDGLVYGLRAHGPWAPHVGHRFNANKLLLDPCARDVVGRYGFDAAGDPCDLSLYAGHDPHDPSQPDTRDNAAVALKARLSRHVFDWRDDRAPAVPWDRTILYEVHVKGATQVHPGIPEALQGCYAGLAHPTFIKHLQRLGVTAVSLLPVQARADEERLQRLGLSNYWGYSSIGFFAPEPRYAMRATHEEVTHPLNYSDVAASRSEHRSETSTTTDVLREFKAMVLALHQADIEVVLDVVFNHSAETDEFGPTLSFRGLANKRYYLLQPDDASRYINWTGCGNCLDFAHPRVVEFALQALRYWVREMHVDGFRFDLAPVLARGPQGFTHAAGFLAAIQSCEILSRVKLIAEPWDIGPDGYQLGNFPPGWHEWNDRFRDSMRAFWLHPGSGPQTSRGDFAQRFAASSDHFQHEHRAPAASINFVTAHDGFTARDLVSYNARHNQANGEGSRDGHADNLSWNCGIEGATDDLVINALRGRLQRALLATLLLSQGTPMLLAGDELGHTQRGNNNAYCQDSPLTWLNWEDADAELCAFVTRTLALRREHSALRIADWLQPFDSDHLNDRRPSVAWLRPDGQPLNAPEWEQSGQGALVIMLRAANEACQESDASANHRALLVINANALEQRFTVPPPPTGQMWLPRLASEITTGEPVNKSPWGSLIDVPQRCVWVAFASQTPESP